MLQNCGPCDAPVDVEVSEHLHGLLGNNTLYDMENDKLFERGPVQHVCFTPSALPLVLATFVHEISHPLQFERPATSLAELSKLYDIGSFVHGEPSSGVELSSKHRLCPVYGRAYPPVRKFKGVHSKKRKRSSSMVPFGKQRGKPRLAMKTEKKAAYEELKVQTCE